MFFDVTRERIRKRNIQAAGGLAVNEDDPSLQDLRRVKVLSVDYDLHGYFERKALGSDRYSHCGWKPRRRSPHDLLWHCNVPHHVFKPDTGAGGGNAGLRAETLERRLI